MHYSHPTITEGTKISGIELKKIIRQGCSGENFGKSIESIPLNAILHAISSQPYELQQITDFIDRLRIVLKIIPSNHTHSIAEYFASDLGRATALDQHVNRPGYVGTDIGSALDIFFSRHPSLSRNPNKWDERRLNFELEILDIYGPSRRMAIVRGVSVAPERYSSIKRHLL